MQTHEIFEEDIDPLTDGTTAEGCTIAVVKYDDVEDLLTRIRDICEEHRGDENYFPNGRLKEVIRLIDGEI